MLLGLPFAGVTWIMLNGRLRHAEILEQFLQVCESLKVRDDNAISPAGFPLRGSVAPSPFRYFFGGRCPAPEKSRPPRADMATTESKQPLKRKSCHHVREDKGAVMPDGVSCSG